MLFSLCRPLSGCELAIGCKEGVFIWNVGDPSTVISRPSINSAMHLEAPNHRDVSSIAWDPHVRFFLFPNSLS